jgi:carbamoyl-phosphate synthase large subunit
MDRIKVLVTGIGGGGNGEQVLKALRLAKDLPLTITGTDVTEHTAGKRFVDVFHKIPPVADPAYAQVLFDIIEREGTNFIFHGSEPELVFISENREKFAERGVRYYLNSKELITLCMNKLDTYRRLDSLGFDMPRFLTIDRVEDLERIDFFPAVLKPYAASGGSNNVYIAFDRDEAFYLGSYMFKRGMKFLAQEYLGSHEEEYTIGTSSDENGKILGSIVLKKIMGNAISTRWKARQEGRLYIVSSGFSQGEICHMPELQRQAEEMAVALHSIGPMNIQGRLVDGKLRLMEINPRLSGSTSLRAVAGYNEPVMAIKAALTNEEWSTDFRDVVIVRGIEEYEM